MTLYNIWIHLFVCRLNCMNSIKSWVNQYFFQYVTSYVIWIHLFVCRYNYMKSISKFIKSMILFNIWLHILYEFVYLFVGLIVWIHIFIKSSVMIMILFNMWLHILIEFIYLVGYLIVWIHIIIKSSNVQWTEYYYTHLASTYLLICKQTKSTHPTTKTQWKASL